MIRILPSNIANLIAAGEVVQRPASVVKELLENSLDAGATQVTLVANDSGRTLVQVIDNGSGMTADEAKSCFARHATSKIATAEDLYKIRTYGFRGEALASIAACADVTLKTKKAGEETGTEVHIAENNIISVAGTNTPQGTNIAVRNIFYNIPARRKFLKSDNVEYRQIVSEFLRVAIPNPDVEFRFIHNSKEIFHFSAAQNLKYRITQAGGKDISKELINLRTETSVVGIEGFIGSPQNARKSQQNQYFFVNGRFFKSPLLHKAVLKAYANLMAEGSQPSYFIFLKIDPENMDVNIHPTKTEIKFENDSIIFEILNAAVKEAIGGNSFIPAIDFDTEGAPEIPVAPKDFSHISQPKINFDPLFNPFRDLDNGPEGSTYTKNHSNTDYYKSDNDSLLQNFEHENKPYNEVFAEENIPQRKLLQLRGKYILTPVKSGLMIIDIKRAIERILYTDYTKALAEATSAVQETLYPQTLNLDHTSYSLLMESLGKVEKLGFDIRPFGNDSIIIYGYPSVLKENEINARECIDNLMTGMQECEGMDFDSVYRNKVALNVIKSVKHTSKEYTQAEAQSIIDRLFACPDYATSPAGLPCIRIITLDEIDNLLTRNF